MLACALFSGVLPTLDDLQGMSPFLGAAAWASPNRWLCEALYVLQVREFSDAWKMPPTWVESPPASNSALFGLHVFHYSDDHVDLNLLMLVVIGCALRLAALAALCGLHREMRDRHSAPKALVLSYVVAPVAAACDAWKESRCLVTVALFAAALGIAALVASAMWW